MLDLDVCQKASRYATRVCQEMTKRSSLIKDLKVDSVPAFERDEIIPFLGDKVRVEWTFDMSTDHLYAKSLWKN